MKEKFDYIARRYLKMGSPILNRDQIKNIVKAQDELETIGRPEHGSHKLDVVKDPEKGVEYIQKQAKSQTETEKEYMMANFLNSVNSDNPKCKLVETNDGSVHVLSYKHKNTQDVEQFVKAGRTNELLEKKVVGLEQTLIADNILGKQSDTKLANMIVRDEGDTLVFSNIDHERALLPTFSIFNSGQIRYPTNPRDLVLGIADLCEPSDDNHSGLAGDERAKEFGEVAMKVMSKEKMKSSYEEVANAQTDSLFKKCSSLAQNSTFFRGKNSCTAYKEHFEKIQKGAAEAVKKFEL